MSIPKGNNSLNALGIFTQKQKYKDLFPFNRVSLPFDIWTERNFHSKVDFNDNPIFIKEENLVVISRENQIRIINFFADAYSDFISEIQKQKIRGKLNLNNSFLNDLTPFKGWESINNIYENYLNIILKSFIEFIEKKQYKNQITNFHNFLEIFYKFIDILNINNLPFLYSDFIKSNIVPNHCGGLILEVFDQKYDLDEQKWSRFIQDSNFKIYTNIAEKFGMKVDLNVPWRLIADIKSPVMQNYISRRLGDKQFESFFDVMYDRGETIDSEKLQEALYRIYNSYYINEPNIEIQEKCKLITIQRERISFNEVKNLSNNVWLKIYFKLRAKNIVINDKRKNKILNEALQIIKIKDLNKGFEFINKNVFYINGQQK